MEDNHKFLFIDPSGSGTTGLYFYDNNSQEEEFSHFKSKEWKEHFLFIKEFCLQKEVNYIVYETTNYIKTKGFDLTNLFKLFGAIETLTIDKNKEYPTIIKKCETIFVSQVKSIYKKLVSEEIKIEGISLIKGRGKGWFKGQIKIEIHELDAFLVFQCFLKKNYSLINKSLSHL